MAFSSHSEPLTIIIFGATGDLSRTKLLAALMDLSCSGCLPADTRIVGVARKELTDEEFQAMARKAIDRKAHEHPPERVEEYLARLRYLSGDFTEYEMYPMMAQYLQAQDAERGVCSNKLYYLSVQPSLYEPIFEQLAHSGLSIPCAGVSWVRIAVEKPFGHDSESAAQLDQKLTALFAEEQIFRIDHYLAKEAMENIIVFRFSNALFEPSWNAEHIESVHIRFLEPNGIGSRGNFYEDVGALRDVGQNHLLQMLAFVAMDDPKSLAADAIRAEREKVLGALVPLSPDELASVVKGQYASYRTEADVAEDSTIETYFTLTTHLDLPRWRGVPFVLEAGKGMHEHRIDITIVFKPIDSCIGSKDASDEVRKNRLTFTMQPEESITLTFFAKKRGFSMATEEKTFSFNYAEGTERLRDAYEKLLLDCIRGDQTLFTTGKEVAAAWRYITPILRHRHNREPVIYEDNTPGPAR